MKFYFYQLVIYTTDIVLIIEYAIDINLSTQTYLINESK